MQHVTTFSSSGEKSIGLGIFAGISAIAEANNAIAQSIKDLSKEIPKGLIQSAKIQAKSNYEIAKSILASSNVVLNGIEHIADAMERKNRLDEYYMLLREITSFEDKIIDMVKSKEEFEVIYQQMQLSEIPIAELDEDAIVLLATAFNEEKFKTTLKSVCFTDLISPIDYIMGILCNEKNFEISITTKVSLKRFLRLKNTSVTPIEFNITISPLWINIPAIDCIGLTTSNMLDKLDNKFDDEYQLVTNILDDPSHLVCHINGHQYYCKISYFGFDKDSQKCQVRRHEKNSTEGSSILPREHFACGREWLQGWNQIRNCYDEERAKKMIERYNKLQHVLYVPDIPAEDAIWILNNIIKQANSNHTLEYESKISEVKSFINDLNKEIALQNLRVLHQQLRLMVRKLKIESL